MRGGKEGLFGGPWYVHGDYMQVLSPIPMILKCVVNMVQKDLAYQPLKSLLTLDCCGTAFNPYATCLSWFLACG